jgi:hypothetical protein
MLKEDSFDSYSREKAVKKCSEPARNILNQVCMSIFAESKSEKGRIPLSNTETFGRVELVVQLNGF